MDFSSLRAEGIAHLEQMTGSSWTDFNAHDPGITILEQLVYGLTDLGYRAGFDLPDLLAGSSADPYAVMHGVEQILTTHPVTIEDFRRLVIGVDGVRNAWIEPFDGGDVDLHFHPGRHEISLDADPPATEPVHLLGLHRVLVEKETGEESSAGLRGRVAERLHAHRPLCEDFAEIRVLDEQLIQVDASIEIEPTGQPESVLVDVLLALANQIAPPLQFISRAEAARNGVATEDLFEGPPSPSGYLDPAVLRASERQTSIHTSDLIHGVMEVPYVQAVTRIEVASGGEPEAWALLLDPAKAPRLDVSGSRIELTRNGLTARLAMDTVLTAYRDRLAVDRTGPPTAERPAGVEPAVGRDRSVGTYQSVQNHLPEVYGLGPLGLPGSASDQRKAQAKQLSAYLLLFDQLLANSFAQLANVGNLFSAEHDDTYVSGVVEDNGLGLAAIKSATYDEQMPEFASPRPAGSTEVGSDRAHRMLDHLLARFGESFSDQSLRVGERASDGTAISDPSYLHHKRVFLQQYPRVSSGRGAAADSLQSPGSTVTSGLADRISLKLGLVPDEQERFVLVEHILLRPIREDRTQILPVLTEAAKADPYSLQMSFVFASAGRFEAEEGRRLANQTIREETPAHITPYVRWLEPEEWLAFNEAHETFLERRRTHLSMELGMTNGHS